ncbi:MAG TPA: BatA domain-containing protein, partial [Anaerolineae bacterium]|nr:BatA domain-containing protein [Anaerolineae bacterium]
MNFLNSIVLFGLGAAVLPLLIHLLSKRKAKEIAFPSIRLLELMQSDRIRMLKVKQLMILLLRTLIIVLIILAFARPALRSVFKGNARTSAVVIIDGSASMLYVDNGELLFNLALRKAEEIINLLKKDDSAAIIFSGKNPIIPIPELTGDKKQLLNVLKNFENSWSTSNPIFSFNMALDLLRSSGALNKEIYYITDGATNALPDSIHNTDKNVRLYTILLGPEERDGSVIEDISLVDKLLVPGKKLTFRVKGLVSAHENEMDIEFFVNGERKGKSSGIKQSGNITVADFTYIPEKHGWYSVYAAVNDGYFEPGEKRRIIIKVTQIVKVLIAGGKPEDMYFLEKALKPDPDESMFSIRDVLETDITQSDIQWADIIVLSGVSDLNKSLYQSLLGAVVEYGKGLIVFPGKNIGSSLYTDGIFRDIFPAVIEKRVDFEGQNDENYSLIDWFDFTHPILRGVSRDGSFHRPEVKAFLKMNPSINTRVLARFNDNSMAAGEIACGKGKAVVFTVDAFSDDSELPLTGIFIPFFIRSVQYLSNTLINGGIYETGDPVIEAIPDVPQNSQVTVKPENSPATLVDIEHKEAEASIKSESAGQPGFYSVLVGTEEKGRFCVNAPHSDI